MAEKKSNVRWIGVAITLIVIIGGMIATWAVAEYKTETVKITSDSNTDRITVIEIDRSSFKTGVEKDISYIQKDIVEIKNGLAKQITVADITRAIKEANK